jgi:hypothetical protein
MAQVVIREPLCLNHQRVDVEIVDAHATTVRILVVRFQVPKVAERS